MQWINDDYLKVDQLHSLRPITFESEQKRATLKQFETQTNVFFARNDCFARGQWCVYLVAVKKFQAIMMTLDFGLYFSLIKSNEKQLKGKRKNEEAALAQNGDATGDATSRQLSY